MEEYKKLLLANKAWVKEKLDMREDYFLRHKDVQTPHFLWVGCADSRVPAEDITGTEPGELFVHRNVANLVVHTDLNLLSVLQYAVDVLKVKHVIICGHYGCGGVKSATSHKNLGLINKWLHSIKDVYTLHKTELNAITDADQRWRRLVELNVEEQVRNLVHISIIQKAWKFEQRPYLHGWVYDLHTGYLKEISLLKPGALPDDVYCYDFED